MSQRGPPWAWRFQSLTEEHAHVAVRPLALVIAVWAIVFLVSETWRDVCAYWWTIPEAQPVVLVAAGVGLFMTGLAFGRYYWP